MKKVIITGATGFIGSWITRILIERDVEVLAVVRRNSQNLEILKNLPIKIIECDLQEYRILSDLISDRNIDTLFHAAWQGVSDSDAKSQDIQLKNLQGTLDLIDAAKEMEIPTFVGCGSIHEQEAILEIKENKVMTNMAYMYKTSKLAAHMMGKVKAETYGIHFFWPLIINTYGEGENSGRLLNTVIRSILKGVSPNLSEGKQLYDFVHIEDVVNALMLIAEKGIDGTNYVIGSGNIKPLREYLIVVGDIVNELKGGTKIPLGFGRVSNNIVHMPEEVLSSRVLVKDTGFAPKISFEEGIERTTRWIMGLCNGE